MKKCQNSISKLKKLDLEMTKLDFAIQKLDLPAFQGSEGDQNYVEKESLVCGPFSQVAQKPRAHLSMFEFGGRIFEL